MPYTPILSTLAYVVRGDDVLMVHRTFRDSDAHLGKFNGLGGKLEPGETPEAALVRELREEIDLHVAADDLQPMTFASHTYDRFHLLMPLFKCTRWKGTVKLLDVSAARFVAPSALCDAEMPAADAPLVRYIQAASGQ